MIFLLKINAIEHSSSNEHFQKKNCSNGLMFFILTIIII